MSAIGRAAAHKNLDASIAEELVNESFGKLFRLPTEEDEYYSEEQEEGESQPAAEDSSL